jgi:hypothetical protein
MPQATPRHVADALCRRMGSLITAFSTYESELCCDEGLYTTLHNFALSPCHRIWLWISVSLMQVLSVANSGVSKMQFLT